MPVTTLDSLMIALFDEIGSSVDVEHFANFTPPSGYPLINLADGQLFNRTRTPDLTADMQITVDLGSAIEFNVFAILGSNATAQALGRFRAADNIGITTNVVQSGSSLTAVFNTSLGSGQVPFYVPPWGRSILYIHPTSITKQYIRWHQSDTSNPDGFQEWGILRVGLGLQFDFETIKIAPRMFGPTGSEKVLRGYEISFHNLSQDEASDLEDLAYTSLSSGRMLVIPEPLNPATWLKQALWCVLESVFVRDPIPGMAHSDRRYRVAMTFREVDR